jgi:hypothetical protein
MIVVLEMLRMRADAAGRKERSRQEYTYVLGGSGSAGGLHKKPAER